VCATLVFQDSAPCDSPRGDEGDEEREQREQRERRERRERLKQAKVRGGDRDLVVSLEILVSRGPLISH